ncbi:hypothetical protein IscW_ISCW022562 [Ixodes scapularis]|uniref:Uncharacterized protein n=1 Tax=Ixodes scapularis TaxID=6945 RepID=B7QG26_IXOSC|nr:hypothetical protein IscW_ISCW022562 [Ixodes scapularis]|eukprot:XP_002401119.1 hypothetical protein IscW_ISCW022562 [Ixodes scapularis]
MGVCRLGKGDKHPAATTTDLTIIPELPCGQASSPRTFPSRRVRTNQAPTAAGRPIAWADCLLHLALESLDRRLIPVKLATVVRSVSTPVLLRPPVGAVHIGGRTAATALRCTQYAIGIMHQEMAISQQDQRGPLAESILARFAAPCRRGGYDISM